MDTFEYLLKCVNWVKVVPVHAKKIYRGSRGIAPLISIIVALAVRREEWSVSRPGRFTPGKDLSYQLSRRLGGLELSRRLGGPQLSRRLGGPQSRIGRFGGEKIFYLSRDSTSGLPYLSVVTISTELSIGFLYVI
jgi:hypothetical protein